MLVEIRLRLEGPQGFTPVERTYNIQSRAPFLPITITRTEPQGAGVSWRAPADALASFQPSAQALISFSNLAGIDPAPLLDALYRYPYGCTEQLTSVAMPLLYYNSLAAEADRARRSAHSPPRPRSGDAIARSPSAGRLVRSVERWRWQRFALAWRLRDGLPVACASERATRCRVSRCSRLTRRCGVSRG